MQALFDIGDIIEMNMKGKIRSYSADKDGDCYTIILESEKDDGLSHNTIIYMETDELIKAKARKIWR